MILTVNEGEVLPNQFPLHAHPGAVNRRNINMVNQGARAALEILDYGEITPNRSGCRRVRRDFGFGCGGGALNRWGLSRG
jgi:hypothetical protein